MKKLLVIFSILICSLGGSMVSAASPELEEIPAEVFEWVQSSSRMDYYFNRQQIHFGSNARGEVDTDIIIAPVLKVYDELMVHDVISKRRWNGKSVEGFNQLAGVAEYLKFDIKAKTVKVQNTDYLDYTFTVIEQDPAEQEIKLEELSHQSFAYKFYAAILDYGMSHQVDLAKRVNSKLDANSIAKLEKAQADYKSKKKAGKSAANE